jgi:hypothetical protein
MKAGYGEPLRQLFGEAAWVEQVIDFGHAKQIFPDADVFPSILVARKPADEPAPATASVCVIPREQLRIDDLSRQAHAEGVPVPLTRFGPAAWNLEPPGATALMEKLRDKGVPLKEFAGVSTLYGVKTGCNEAFVIDRATRDRLIEEHPASVDVIKPYLRGRDINRWQADYQDLWLIYIPWHFPLHLDPSIAGASKKAEELFARSYPAVYGHLSGYRKELEARNKAETGVRYEWYALQRWGAEYWEQFGRPKLMYQEIQFHPCYALDRAGMLANNKTFFIPTDDLYLLGVLNSPVMWWHNWRYLPHMKDEALSPVGFKMDELPIPRPMDQVRSVVQEAVRRLIEITGERAAGCRAVLDWLRLEFGIEKPSQRLAATTALDADGLIGEVKKLRGSKAPLSVADVKRLRAEHAASVVPLQELDREAAGLERRTSNAVNTAFGLTPADVQLMWDTAPPRMPFGPPGSPGTWRPHPTIA